MSASLDVEEEEIQPGTRFVDLGADSLELAMLMQEFEEALNIEIPDDDFHKLNTVQDVINYANSRSLTR